MEKKCALVVDDNDLFRETVADLLSEVGYDSLLATNPEEAVEILNSNTVNIIFCDLVLPTDYSNEPGDLEEDEGSAMVGVGAIHNFKKKCPNVPIVAMSGIADSSTLRAIESFGAAESLKKPFSLDELTRVVNKLN